MTHAVTPLDSEGQRDGARVDLDGNRAAGSTSALLAALAVLAGLAILIVAFANLPRISGWATEFGTVAVYLGFFLVMSVAGRLFWWGTDFLVGRVIHGGQAGR